MEVIEAILARHSARDYKSDAVSRDTVTKILEAATRSPSSGNSQPWQIFVAGGAVMDRIRLGYVERFEKDVPGKPEIAGTPINEWPAVMQERMRTQAGQRMKLLGIDPQDKAAMRANMAKGSRFFGAPVLVVLCIDKTLSDASTYDIGLLTQSILLAALGHGVASIVARSFVIHPDILRKELEVPDSLQIVIGIALGYKNTASIINTYRSPRRPLQEVVTFKGI